MDAYDFMGTFQDCRSLTEIPGSLFDKCTGAGSFMITFLNCNRLTEIPAGLFDNCKHIRYFAGTFAECRYLKGESPYTLIDGKKVHLYERTKENGFVEPEMSGACFSECFGLTDFADIPAG